MGAAAHVSYNAEGFSLLRFGLRAEAMVSTIVPVSNLIDGLDPSGAVGGCIQNSCPQIVVTRHRHRGGMFKTHQFNAIAKLNMFTAL